MAEFGSQATRLSAPQGAGASPLAPVSSGVVKTFDLAPVAKLVDAGMSLFQDNQKAKQEKLRQSTLQQLSEEVNKIDQAGMTGQYTPSEANTRRQMLIQQSAAEFPHLIDDIRKIAALGKDFGMSGDIQQRMDDERKERHRLITKANDRGLYIGPNDPPEIVNEALQANQTATRLEEQLREAHETRKRQAEIAEIDQKAADRDLKNQSRKLLGKMADNQYDYFIKRVGQVAKSGGMSEEAKAGLQQHYLKVRGQIQMFKGSNPEMASATLEMFDTAWKQIEDYFKPGGDTKALENELSRTKAFYALEFIKSNPVAAKAVGVEAAGIKNHPYTVTGLDTPIQQFLGTTLADKEPTQVVVGDGNKERQTNEGLMKMVKAFKTPEEKAQLNNALKHYVDQFDTLNLKGKLREESASRLFGLIGSPEMSKYIKENNLPPETINQLNNMYQKRVTQVFEQNLEKKLIGTLAGNRVGIADTMLGMMGHKFKGAQSLAETVKVEHNGVGLTFTPVSSDNNTAEGARELNKLSATATQLVNVGAAITRMEPKAFWESQRHLFLPSMGYPVPEKPKDTMGDVSQEKNMAAAAKVPDSASDVNSPIRIRQDILDIENELRTAGPYARQYLEAELRKLKGQ